MDKFPYIHTVEYFTAIKRSEVLVDITWMILSQVNWAKDTGLKRERTVQLIYMKFKNW